MYENIAIYDPIDYSDFLISIIENQNRIIDIQMTQLGYLEFIVYIVLPGIFVVGALWWFFRQFITSYR